MKESKTAYAYLIEHMDKPSFSKVWDIAYDFVRKLPSGLSDELHESLNRGVEELDTEPLLQMYMYAFGKMHNAKLQFAFSQTGNRLTDEGQIQIIDYGCGQGLSSICYHDFIIEHNPKQKVAKIVLIEPSTLALSRAELMCSRFYPDTEIVAVNSSFDNLNQEDITILPEVTTLHLFSNILDIESYNLQHLIQIVSNLNSARNEVVIVSPIVNDARTQRLKTFATNFNGHIYYENYLGKRQLDEERDWTCSILLCSDRTNQELIVSKCDKIFEEAQSFKDNKNSDWEDENSIKLFRELQICAESGDAKCQNQLGIWYIKGIGTSPNIRMANEWFQKASQQEYPNAVANLALSYDLGEGVTQNYNMAFKLYQKAYNLNFLQVSARLAICYLKGHGCVKDTRKAIELLQNASEHNITDAQTLLGKLYFNGRIIDKNVKQALSLWETAGEQNNLVALRLIGNYYSNPKNKEQDLPRAIKYYTKACQLKDHKSLIALINIFCKQEYKNLFKSVQFDIFANAVKDHIPEVSKLTEFWINRELEVYSDDIAAYGSNGLRLIYTKCQYSENIDGNLFSYKTFKTYRIKDGTRVICRNAFVDCKKLKNIIFPSSINYIGDYAFHNCISLECMDLPKSLFYIGDGAFDCEGHAVLGERSDRRERPIRITIPESVEVINGNPFCANSIIESENQRFKVIDNVLYSSDGKVLISYCASMDEFTIPVGVVRIGKGAFRNRSIKKINFPNTLEIIEEEAFRSTRLKEICFPESLKEIQEKAFEWCYFQSGKISFPYNISQIDPEAFQFGWYVKIIRVPKGRVEYYNSIIPEWMSNQIVDEDVLYENGLYLNTERTEIISAYGLNEKIEIPNGIKRIRDHAFDGIYRIEKISLPNTLKDFSIDIFECETTIDKICVPVGYKSFFASKLPDFEDIIEEIE